MEEISGSIRFRSLGPPDGMKPGQEIRGDIHAYDHTTTLHNGHWRIIKRRKLGPDRWEVVHQITVEAPYHVLIEGSCQHDIKFFGQLVPSWMEVYLAQMPREAAAEFRKRYESEPGRGWCIYSRSLDTEGVMLPPEKEPYY